MRYCYMFAFLFCSQMVWGQGLHVDSTRFLAVKRCCAYINNAIATNDKGIVFVGNTSTDPSGIIPSLPIDSLGYNVLIGKLDSNQKVLWAKVYGGYGYDDAKVVCQTKDGGYGVLAETQSSNGDITGYYGRGDMWFLRLSDTGALLWAKCYGSTMSDEPISVAATPDHGFIILGYTDGGNGDVPIHYGPTYSFDWILIKIDSLGNRQWSKTIGTTGDEGGDGSILVVDSQYYLISSTITKDIDCRDTSWHVGVNTSYDVYVLKLNTNGDILWSKSYGGSNDDDAVSSLYDERDSTIVIGGWTRSKNYMVTSNHGYMDYWVLKIKANGDLIWQKTLGGLRDDNLSGICKGKNGGYLVTGGTFPGPFGDGDCWLFELDSTGNSINDLVIGGAGPEHNVSAIVPYLNTYALLGTSGSAFFTEGSCNINNSGGFISYLKYSNVGISNVNYSGRNTVEIYPNPADQSITIKTPNKQQGTIVFYNTIGKEISRYKITVDSHTLLCDLNDWSSGLYMVQWIGEDGNRIVEKFLKY